MNELNRWFIQSIFVAGLSMNTVTLNLLERRASPLGFNHLLPFEHHDLGHARRFYTTYQVVPLLVALFTHTMRSESSEIVVAVIGHRLVHGHESTLGLGVHVIIAFIVCALGLVVATLFNPSPTTGVVILIQRAPP